MKKSSLALCIIPFILLCGCGRDDESSIASQVSNHAAEVPPLTTKKIKSSVSVTERSEITSITEKTTETIETETTAATESVQTITDQQAADEEQADEIDNSEEKTDYEVFTGILIDEDCSDFDPPPEHDLPCMLMDSCRASGYGIDIQQEDGSWRFYMFDEKGQDLSLDYLLHTDRMSELYVTVTGVLENDIIYVENLEEY